MMRLSIVIPVVREPRLERTINRIKATCGRNLPELVIVFDGDRARNYAIDYPTDRLVTLEFSERRGTGPARDAAIMAASRDTVFCTDAHVDWWDGSHWASRLVELSARYPKDILCCRMRRLDIDHMFMPGVGEPAYTGATLALRCQENHQRTILSAKWERQETGIIPVVMGAGYTFNRRRYIDHLGRPWRLNQGWGLDEETLSLINWISGGESRLVDVEIGHPFDLKKYPWKPTETKGGIWSSRLSLLAALPMSDILRESLENWANSSPYIRKYKSTVLDTLFTHRIVEMSARLTASNRTLDDFISRFDIKDRFDCNPPEEALQPLGKIGS